MDKEKEHIIADKTMLRVARITSIVFTPFSIPFLAFLVLFLFSYLRIMPILYKGIVLGIVYCFTILTPTITIFLFRKINGFARQELSERMKWKLSEHMAGMGGIIGGLVSFSALFSYNPVVWLCLFILIAGILGSARIVLGHHTLGEVLSGFVVGLVCSFLILHPAYNLIFRVFLF